MKNNNTLNNRTLDILTVGFALFAMFFGAGNLIFPPYLGWTLGDHWILGFFCYLAVDIGFSFIALLIIARSGRGSESITEKLGHKISAVFIGVICICIGPAIAIPRVASITYEVGIKPNLPEANSVICMGIFFAIVWVLCISKSGVVDIVGKILSPLMVIALLVMIIKGIMSPIGDITVHSTSSEAIYMGITSGYQTMDMMASVIFAITIIFSITEKGYTEKKQQFPMILFGGLIATALLFMVYGGLTYIGASLHTRNAHYTQVDILTTVTERLLGDMGLLLLGIVVALACLTTAIGLITSISEFFEEKLHIKYPILVTAFVLISFGISNFGTDVIIGMAAPVLSVIYPVLIFMTFASIAGDKLPTLGYRIGAGTAFVVSLLQQIESAANTDLVSQMLPLNDYGFGWIAPAIVGMLAGIIIAKPREGKSK